MITFEESTVKTIHIPDVEWQTPVITEKLAYECLLNAPLRATEDITYLAVPWATLIDNLLWGTDAGKKTASSVLRKVSQLDHGRYFTVCQHYKYREIESLFRNIGGEVIYTPHAETTDDHSIQGFPLYSPVTGDPNSDKPIWYSFIGAHKDHYISGIREHIFGDNHPDNCIVVRRGVWQFNIDVYTEQIWGNESTGLEKYIANEKKKYYKRILERSRFSLCPAGAGPSSIRFFESLASGSIPVLLADTLALPKVNAVDWNECIIRVPEDKYSQLRDILGKISPEREIVMRQNCIEAYKRLSGENFAQCIRDYYE